jgi:hypothetical protein
MGTLASIGWGPEGGVHEVAPEAAKLKLPSQSS